VISKQQRAAALYRLIDRLADRISALERRADTLSNLRLLAAVVGIGATAVLFTFGAALGWGSLLVSVVVFGGLVWGHRRLTEAIHAHITWRGIKQAHLARLSLDWERIPMPPFRVAHTHMLETDLDLDNLHRLLNTATSRGGSARLRDWLIPVNPDAAHTAERQARAEELVSRPLFRDKLTLAAALAAEDLQQSGEGQSLSEWLAGETTAPGMGRWVVVLALLSVFNITSFFLNITGVTGGALLSVGLVAYASVFAWQYRRVFTLFEDALTIEGALRRLDAVTRHLESWNYAGMPHTAATVAPLLTGKPSARLRQVTRILSGASLRGNPILWLIINAVVPWDFFFGWRLNAIKGDLRDEVPAWLDVWHEIEATASLATFAYLNPAYTVPRIGGDLPAVFDATALGHPLIPDATRVTNDFMMTDLGDIVIVTGSNMSGKSSFLRTIGVNLCLAYAGARVCANGLDTVVFRPYTSIRVTDSLDDGISYFYAEVRRLKGLLEAVQQEDAPPVFFLIDEIFRGTNNRERLIGSRSFIRALAGLGATGLVATHDLELAKLPNVDEQVRNAHFREDIVDGLMVFDYKLRAGPSPTTNALRIMAMEGLPVEEGAVENARETAG